MHMLAYAYKQYKHAGWYLVALSLPFDDLCVPLGSWNKRVLTEVCRVFQLPESSIPAVQPLCRISPGWPPPVQGGEGGDGGEEAERDASSSAAAALWPAHDVSEEERRAQNLGVFSELLQASTPSVRYEMLRVLLSTLVVRVGGYDARARGMMQQLATAIDVQWSGEEGLSVAEDSLARVLLAQAQAIDGRCQRKDRWRAAKIAGATVGGGALLFVTGGLAAPALAAAITSVSII